MTYNYHFRDQHFDGHGFFTSRTSNGFSIHRTAAADGSRGARPCSGEFKANAQKYMDGTFPWENMKKLADIGVLGMSVPEQYGGLGLPGIRHGAGARGDCEDLLCHRHGHPR